MAAGKIHCILVVACGPQAFENNKLFLHVVYVTYTYYIIFFTKMDTLLILKYYDHKDMHGGC